MTKEEHIKRHVELHGELDALLADFIRHTSEPPLGRPIRDLLHWSYKQTIDPEE